MTLHRPAVGELEITAEVLTLLGDPNLVIITYTAQPHSASEPALDFLANWSTRRWHPGITARCHTATTPL